MFPHAGPNMHEIVSSYVLAAARCPSGMIEGTCIHEVKGPGTYRGTRPLSRPSLQRVHLIYPACRGRPEVCCHGWKDAELVSNVAKDQWLYH